jgi:leucyl-tRNA synthetase
MALRHWNYMPLANEKESIDYNPDEPFQRFFAHGLIIKDGAKMSKSKGNVVVPDQYINLYGADTLRTYLMFLGPFSGGGDFRDTGIAGMYKWLSRVWRLVTKTADLKPENLKTKPAEALKQISLAIQSVSRDLAGLKYNTAIAKLMEFTNWWMDHEDEVDQKIAVDFLKLLAPFAPHMTEELFQNIKYQIANIKIHEFTSIHLQPWPTYDSNLVLSTSVTMVVQINGKLRDSFNVDKEKAMNQQMIEQLIKESAKAQKWLKDEEIKKIIFVPAKLINFVV